MENNINLPIYYKKLFPFDLYYRWLSYGETDKNYFKFREFSFTIKNDVYIRYLSFSSQQELEEAIALKIPNKIDIGAVYNFRPKDRLTINKFYPVHRELVFDIDITDYDDVRRCCKEADVCSKCWPLMSLAVKILDAALREDFGFEHILWVFSGRRGIHCWVCDETARKLEKDVRSAIAEYLSVVVGGENMARKVDLEDPVHPSIARAFNIIKEDFEKLMLIDQCIMSDERGCQQVLSIIPDIDLRKMIEKEIESLPITADSIDKWNLMSKIVSRETSKNKFAKSQRCRQEIMLQFCYPRLDVHVTTGMNHLLKSPFSVHPKTGRVSVPIDPNTIDDFDPFKVPTIRQLCDELLGDQKVALNNDDNTSDDLPRKKLKSYETTSLLPYTTHFQRFVNGLEKMWNGQKLNNNVEL